MDRTVKYDGRFGHVENCVEATWLMNRSQHGERWRFRFENGREVSVIRNASWFYELVAENLSTAASMGYPAGLYEVVEVNGRNFGDPEGYLDFDEVAKYLDKVKAM